MPPGSESKRRVAPSPPRGRGGSSTASAKPAGKNSTLGTPDQPPFARTAPGLPRGARTTSDPGTTLSER
eukprot:8184384-Alexandrium_andersonii.AAC.1